MLPMSAPLRRVSLQRLIWHSDTDLQLPWTTLTSLSLFHIPLDLSVQAFIRCPNLVRFCCLCPSDLQDPLTQVTLSNPISFRHLVEFQWTAKYNAWSRALLQHLRVPALQKLYWLFENGEDENSDIRNSDIKGFFNRLPPTLTTAELQWSTSHLEYIPDNSNLKCLDLGYCASRDILTLFHKLTPKPHKQPVVKPFPRLEIIWVTGTPSEMVPSSKYVTLPSSYSIALVEMLEWRLVDPADDSFVLGMEDVVFDWAPDAKARLERLINKGYYIFIDCRGRVNEFENT